MTALVNLNEVRRDPEGFQKMCLVALSIIQGINYCCQRNYLPRLVKLLDIANALDFYGFLKLPYYFHHLIDPKKVDEFKTLDALEQVLCDNWNLRERSDPAVRQFARNCLSGILGRMTDHDLASIDSNHFKFHLQEWLKHELALHPQPGWDRHAIRLDSLTISQRKDSWLERLTNFTFIVVDLLCLPAFLQDWELADFSSYATRLSQWRLFKWVENQKLDDWIRGGLCLGFLLRFLEACRCLCEASISVAAKSRARFDLVVSAAECVFNFSVLLRCHPLVVIALTFIAKSLGVVSIIYRPGICHFEG